MNALREMARNIRRVAMIPAAGFALLCLFLGYWQIVEAPGLRASKHNARARERLEKIEPGEVLDTDGESLLGVVHSGGEWERTYPAGRFACHITGYNDRSGVQKSLREALLGIGRYESPWSEFAEGPLRGNDVTLTMDLDAQRLATRLLEGRRGAVVALGAQSGAILALVSAPAYDPETILSSKWEYQLFQQNPDKPELNRALQGKYPPGSVMKILTGAAALDLDRVERTTEFDCDGDYELDGSEITCPRAHGTVTLDEALQVSCNTTFARLGEYLTPREFVEYADRFGLLGDAALPLPSSRGEMADFDGDNAEVMLAESAIGQGETLVTPLGIARMTLAVANDGTVLAPHIVSRIIRPGGDVGFSAQREEIGRAVSAETARTVAGMMVHVVEDGTAEVAQIRGVSVAGKTGSAQNPHGQAHSWFTPVAPPDQPEVVVPAGVEKAGAGAEAAGPIVREVLAHLLNRAGAI